MGLRDDVKSPCDKTWTGRHTVTCGHKTGYQMRCKNCDDTTYAYAYRDDFVCIVCGYTTDAESGQVFDIDEANAAYAEYRGLKQAGIIKEDWMKEEERLFDE